MNKPVVQELKRGELFMSDLSENAPHMMNVPDDEDEPAHFGGKYVDPGDDLGFATAPASKQNKNLPAPHEDDSESEVESSYGGNKEKLMMSQREDMSVADFDEEEAVETLAAGRTMSMSRTTRKQQERKIKTQGAAMCGKNDKACCELF